MYLFLCFYDIREYGCKIEHLFILVVYPKQSMNLYKPYNLFRTKMGANYTILKTLEVSFVDRKTGKIYPEEIVVQISNAVCREYDYPVSYYEAYKPDSSGNNPYDTYASELLKGDIQ